VSNDGVQINFLRHLRRSFLVPSYELGGGSRAMAALVALEYPKDLCDMNGSTDGAL
jgi:hypothetical protein